MPAASPCPDLDQLRRFTLGLIAEEEAPPLERHLAQCPRCRAALGSLEAEDMVTQALRGLPGLMECPGPPEAIEQLIARIKRLHS